MEVLIIAAFLTINPFDNKGGPYAYQLEGV